VSDALLPRSPAAITPEWLEARLVEARALASSARIASLRIAPVDLGGVNGDVYRITPGYATGSGPASLIVKFPASAAASRGVARFQRWYEREVRAYRELATAGALPAPTCYVAGLTDDGGLLLLLEDLGARRHGDQLAGCSKREADAALRAIARVHARWWGAPALERDLAWLPLTTVGLDRAQGVQGAFARGWGLARQAVALPARFRPIADRAVERYPALLEEAATPPLTVVHGDYRLDNLFFDEPDAAAGGDAAATRVTAIDWQFTCRCRGVYDVAYFLGLDLPPDDRRTLERPLLDAYLEALAADGVAGYERGAAQRMYAVALLLAFATFAIGAAGAHADERMRLVHEVGLGRLAEAILDNDAARVL